MIDNKAGCAFLPWNYELKCQNAIKRLKETIYQEEYPTITSVLHHFETRRAKNFPRSYVHLLAIEAHWEKVDFYL